MYHIAAIVHRTTTNKAFVIQPVIKKHLRIKNNRMFARNPHCTTGTNSEGGCSGMQYGMVFDEKRDDDCSAQFYGVAVLVDPFSANYLRGAVVDFKDELNGGGFKITNPKARQSCGCGKSFEA